MIDMHVHGAGEADHGLAATAWMNLPMTENGISSLMCNDDFQACFSNPTSMILAWHSMLGA